MTIEDSKPFGLDLAKTESDIPKKKISIHVFTDSTGETTINICKVTLSQFKDYDAEFFSWPFLQSIADIDPAIEAVKNKPGIVVYTVLPQDLIIYMHDKLNCMGDSVKIVPALEQTMKSFAEYTNTKVTGMVSRNQIVDVDYHKKIHAIQYAMKHDDGIITDEIEQADIILVGVSRTSKTPTSLYLAYRGYMVANVPFVNKQSIPDFIYQQTHATIVGLSIDPLRLIELRKNRILSGNQVFYGNDYTDLNEVENEITECRYFFGSISCPVVDVTDRSIEEIATQIIKIENFIRDKNKNAKPFIKQNKL